VERKTPPVTVPAKRSEPSAANALKPYFDKPVLTVSQLIPLLVETKTPREVPAKRFVPETRNASTSTFAKSVEVQLDPLLVERKAPL
jgi:hypothetical protein